MFVLKLSGIQTRLNLGPSKLSDFFNSLVMLMKVSNVRRHFEIIRISPFKPNKGLITFKFLMIHVSLLYFKVSWFKRIQFSTLCNNIKQNLYLLLLCHMLDNSQVKYGGNSLWPRRYKQRLNCKRHKCKDIYWTYIIGPHPLKIIQVIYFHESYLCI